MMESKFGSIKRQVVLKKGKRGVQLMYRGAFNKQRLKQLKVVGRLHGLLQNTLSIKKELHHYKKSHNKAM